MKKKYRFDVEKGVFTLYDPETGKDWSNHLLNDSGYETSVSHLGGTHSRYLNENAVQVTLNCPNTSFLYLRDRETGRYWNTTAFPALRPVTNYRCEHGQTFTRISSEYRKIRSSVTYVVAPDDTREVWKVTVQNVSGKRRFIDLFFTTAFDLNGYAQPVYYSAVTTSATEFVKEANAVFNENRNPYRPHEISSGYVLSSEPVAFYDGNFEKFIGTAGSLTKPRLLERKGDCTGSSATVRCRGGILENCLELAPNEEKTVYCVLGLISSKEELISRYGELIGECEGIIDRALCGEGRYGHLRAVCPEEQFNRIFNYWAEHQVSYCMLGKKAVRDNAQLGMAMLNFNVELAKKTIEECIVHEYSDGHAVLTWHPYPEKNVYSDPSVWLALAVCAYVQESGDFDWLNRSMPYLDGGEETVYGHLKAIVAWFSRKDNYGRHGLPLIHHADWNDALNIPDENAESVLMAMLVCKAFEEIASLAGRLGDRRFAEEVAAKRKNLARLTNEVAFNGEYYVRAFSKYGTVGDKTCENGGKIYVNPQSWSILSGVCPESRLASVLSAIGGMETERGIPLCAPPYREYDERVGRMSGMLEGVYENGGIYNHAGCFKVMADCLLGRGNEAAETLKKIVPDGKYNPSSVTTTEPYVFTNCYLTHPSVEMQVGFSWQTGTSAWGLMCYYEGILGLKRGYDGLYLAPALPKAWKKAEAWRTFRGNRLHFIYKNHGGKKIVLRVDGKKVKGNRVPLFKDNAEHTVEVSLLQGE